MVKSLINCYFRRKLSVIIWRKIRIIRIGYHCIGCEHRLAPVNIITTFSGLHSCDCEPALAASWIKALYKGYKERRSKIWFAKSEKIIQYYLSIHFPNELQREILKYLRY